MARIDTGGECEDNWTWIRWEGARKSALRGKPGQTAMRRMRAALLALPEPRLIAGALAHDGRVCALGALVAYDRGIKQNLTWVEAIDEYEDVDSPTYIKEIVRPFGIAGALAEEIMIANDEAWTGFTFQRERAGTAPTLDEQERERFRSVMRWLDSNIIDPVAP